jgi:Ca2+-binding EF-hand superfamily protein
MMTRISTVVILIAGVCLAGARSWAVSPAPPSKELLALVFFSADTDGDGFISEAEFVRDTAAAFSRLDLNHDGFLEPSELDPHDRARFVEIDINQDGKLDFIEVMTARMKDFRAMDTNHDGKLSPAEVQAFQPHAWEPAR